MIKIREFWRSRTVEDKVWFAILLAVTLLVMFWVYAIYYPIFNTSEAKMEQTIGNYFFTEDVTVDIVSQEDIGKHRVIFFQRVGYEGYTGTAILERGILGSYGMIWAKVQNNPLYCCGLVDLYHVSIANIMVTAPYTLEGVSTYEIIRLLDNRVVYSGPIQEGPFMQILTLKPEDCYVDFDVYYYDEAGNRLDERDLRERMPTPAPGGTPSVGTAERDFVYIFEIAIFLLGLAISVYVLCRGTKEFKNL